MEKQLFIIQRVTAVLLAPVVVLHLGLMFYVTRSELSAEDILMRTQGSTFWGVVYTLFFLVAAIHGSIGLRKLILDWGWMNEKVATIVSLVFAGTVICLGLRAVVLLT